MTSEVGKPGEPRSMKASEFKATFLKLMDEVAESGEEIVITKNGRPVAKLAPYRDKPRTLRGRDRGKLKIHGDIISPVDVEWEGESNPDRVKLRTLRGRDRGKLKILGDVISPVDVEWEAESNPDRVINPDL